MRSLIERLEVLSESPKADAKAGGAKSKAGAVAIEGDVAMDITLSLREMSKLLRRIPLELKIADAKGRPFTYRVNLKYGGKGVA